YALARTRFRDHGIQTGDLDFDLKTMLQRKDRVVKGLTDGVAYLFKKNQVTFLNGAARLAAAKQIKVETAQGKQSLIEASSIVLATGSAPAALKELPFDGTRVVSSTEALSFDSVPQNLIVVGGGYIGLELGSVWSRLGTSVTVVEFLPRILAL